MSENILNSNNKTVSNNTVQWGPPEVYNFFVVWVSGWCEVYLQTKTIIMDREKDR